MIYQLTSINLVIAKIIRDLGLNQSNDEIPVNDFIEWCAEALLHVGSYYQMKEKTCILEINDFKSKLPCDFYKLNEIIGGYYYNEGINNNYLGNRGYHINFDNITTNYQSGQIRLRYLAMPIDEEGAPLIPDNQSFRDLLFWKVVYQLSIRGYNFTNSQLKDTNFSRQKLNFYTNQARAESNMPDATTIDRVSSRFKSWTSSFPNCNIRNYNWNSHHF